MAARCPTAERSRPGVHELRSLPSAKTEMVATRARPLWRLFRSGDVSRRVLGSISPRICRSMSELDFREELVALSRLARQLRCISDR